jgi:hypothetical protein
VVFDFYIPPSGPDHDTPAEAKHLWGELSFSIDSFTVILYTCPTGAITAMKARNDEWVGARPDVGSTVLLWTRDIAHPKGIATEKRFLYKRGELWTGLWSGGSSSALEGRGSSGVWSG